MENDIQTFEFRIDSIREEALRIIEDKEKPQAFDIAEEYVKWVEDSFMKLSRDEQIKVFARNLENVGDEEVMVNRYLDLITFDIDDPDYLSYYHDLLQYYSNKFSQVYEDIRKSKISFRINGEVLKGDAGLPKKSRIKWSTKTLFQLMALFELLEEAGMVERGTFTNLGRILGHTSYYNNKPINIDSITKKKAIYKKKRRDLFDSVVGELDKANNRLSE